MGLEAIDLVISVYTNKQMLVGVYLDKGRVYDTPELAEIVKDKHLLSEEVFSW